ncbi:hypothetical protein B0H16DRAFT_1313090 [Mycena metata]|uniref:BTB domain-containing protein n=1 Tax=Mycena metata TaxID=1033252 RepID=A0AAD7JD77_9AGAR|nr:hypothetical protein B0H16DRAFT_1313090 [Mycena metata]
MDIETSTPVANLTHAEGLWFKDCGLIIQAETTLFRVSRDFLAMRSPVFADMLSMPTPVDAEMMEGCPFVRLPDAARDVTYFLKALIYSEFFEPWPTKALFPVVAGVLRMSHKYQVDVLRRRALLHLSSQHPMTLDDWDATGKNSMRAHGEFLLEVILLARQTSALWILPVAFYNASTRLDIEILITGLDGRSLETTDVIACVQGLRYLDTTATSNILDFLTPRAIPGCVLPVACAQKRGAKRSEVEAWRVYEPQEDTNPIAPLDMWEQSDYHGVDVCGVCRSYIESFHRSARQSLWSRLPEIFGLPPWAELEQLKTEALN